MTMWKIYLYTLHISYHIISLFEVVHVQYRQSRMCVCGVRECIAYELTLTQLHIMRSND